VTGSPEIGQVIRWRRPGTAARVVRLMPINPSQPCVVSAAAKWAANARYAAALGWKRSSANISGQDTGGMATRVTTGLRLAICRSSRFRARPLPAERGAQRLGESAELPQVRQAGKDYLLAGPNVFLERVDQPVHAGTPGPSRCHPQCVVDPHQHHGNVLLGHVRPKIIQERRGFSPTAFPLRTAGPASSASSTPKPTSAPATTTPMS
jgi:hypothetical protein